MVIRKKQVYSSIIALVFACLLVSGCGSKNTETVGENEVGNANEVVEQEPETVVSEDEFDVRETVTAYLDTMKSGEFDKSQEYLTTQYDYVDNTIIGLHVSDDYATFLTYLDYEIIDVIVEDNIATVNLKIKHPHVDTLLDAFEKALMSGKYEESDLSHAIIEALTSTENPIQIDESTATLALKKKQKNWEIIADTSLTRLFEYGSNQMVTPETITENEKKKDEEKEYISQNIELTDYIVEMCKGYSGTVPGIKDISIKNNGTKDIESLTVTIDFFDETGTTIASKDLVVLGMFDDPIKAGYSWKMENGKFYEIENLAENVIVEKCKAYISEARFIENTNSNSGSLTAEQQYIYDSIELLNYEVKMCKGYSKTSPGLLNVSVKNNGDRDISELRVTVYFQDENGKNIAEDSFLLIGGLWGGDTLKSNYSWKMESGKYFEIANLADEVDISRYTVEVTEIKFE